MLDVLLLNGINLIERYSCPFYQLFKFIEDVLELLCIFSIKVLSIVTSS